MRISKRTVEREILDGVIFFLSLVDEGANEVEPVLKGKKLTKHGAVAKLGKEGLLHCLVYGPDTVDYHGDVARKRAVQNLAHKYIPSMVGSGIDVMHNCRPVDRNAAHVCESFIIQSNGDDRFKGVTVKGKVIEDTRELEGWWAAIIKLNDPALRRGFEDGTWRGVSMFGDAIVREVDQDEFTTALAARRGTQPQPQPESDDMDEATLAAAIAKALAPLTDKVDALTAAQKPATPEPVRKSTPDLTFEGDPTDLADVEAHEERVFQASLDFNKPSDIAKWKTYLAKKAKAKAEGGDGENTELAKAKADAAAAQARVAQLQKASNQGSGDVDTGGKETPEQRQLRIRKAAKEAANEVLVSQGRRQAS